MRQGGAGMAVVPETDVVPGGMLAAGQATALAHVEAVNVRKQYGGRESVNALEAISLNIAKGEFVSILGPSGCGKTTFLRCIAGLERPSDGTIKVGGQIVNRPPEGMGMVFQRDVLLDWRTIIDDPSLLLMDEPFGALDAMTRDQLNVELQRIWQATHKTVVFITHSIPEAVFLSDRVEVFSPRPGRIALSLDIDLPRPRRMAMRHEAEFNHYCSRIRELFEAMGLFQEE